MQRSNVRVGAVLALMAGTHLWMAPGVAAQGDRNPAPHRGAHGQESRAQPPGTTGAPEPAGSGCLFPERSRSSGPGPPGLVLSSWSRVSPMVNWRLHPARLAFMSGYRPGPIAPHSPRSPHV